MIIERQDIINKIQSCINLYKGKYGEVNPVYDYVETYVIDNVEFIIGMYKGRPNHAEINLCGSNQPMDWIKNFMVAMKKIPYNINSKIRVQEGWYIDYLKTRDIILKLNKHFESFDYYGHSKGYPGSQLGAADMQYNFPEKKIRCFGFGGPAVFNKEGAESFNRRVTENVLFVYNGDLVSKVPLRYTQTEKIYNFDKVPDGKFINHYPINYLKAAYLLPEVFEI